jgi:hypothetical protein
MPTQATALFADRHAAHAAVEQLVQAGFPRDAISVVMSLETFEREFGGASGHGAPTRSGVRPVRCGVLGTIVDGLVALSGGGGGPPPHDKNVALRAAGPIVQAMLLAGENAANLSDKLMAAGLTERAAGQVVEAMRGGALVVGVQAADRKTLALQLLALSGGDALQAA